MSKTKLLQLAQSKQKPFDIYYLKIMNKTLQGLKSLSIKIYVSVELITWYANQLSKSIGYFCLEKAPNGDRSKILLLYKNIIVANK